MVVAQQRWKNSVMDVKTTYNLPIETDHKLVAAKIRAKLAKKKQDRIDIAPRYYKPDGPQLAKSNEHINKACNETRWNDTIEPITKFKDIVKDAAEQRYFSREIFSEDV